MRATLLAALLIFLGAGPHLVAPARAKSWCARPLFVHEWGVHVFRTGGDAAAPDRREPRAAEFFHDSIGPGGVASTPVRALPVDSGERDLPVVHFYAPDGRLPIPLGVEVGFSHGPASAWYPQVDLFRSAADANGPEAATARRNLLAARAARTPGRGGPALPPDPTRQLVWEHLILAGSPATAPVPTKTAWVADARGFDQALWLDGAGESERFLFYEARTAEKNPLALVRGATFAAGRRHYELHNRGAHAVHDVFVVHREAGRLYVFFAPMIPAGKHAGFLLEEHAVAAGDAARRTRDHLVARLVDPARPAPPEALGRDDDDCVMMRDPAIPVESAAGHHLYRHEADAILRAWGKRFFDQQGTTILFREDLATLDDAMPLSLYTDMFHHVVLQRAGLALWEDVPLP